MTTPTAIDRALAASVRYAEGFTHGDLLPRADLAVLVCMDARIQVEVLLGLDAGDAFIVSNAGGVVNEDALASLIMARHLGEVREVMVINHTQCGAMAIHGTDFRRQLEEKTGRAALEPNRFPGFTDPAVHAAAQVEKIRAHPWLGDVTARAFVYDVATGRLTEAPC